MLVGAIAGSLQAQQLVAATPQTQTARAPQPERSDSAAYMPLDRARTIVPALRTRVTLRVDDMPLDRALELIAAQAKLGISYGEDLVRAGTRVSFTVAALPAAEVLAAAVRGTAWDVLATSGGNVTVTRRVARAATLTGRVTDSASTQPIAGAQVTIAGTQLGGLTNAEGRYTIAAVPPGTHTVQVRRIGFAQQSRAITVTAEQTTVTADFQLQAQVAQLTAVVSVGYGTQNRENVTSAIASVRGEDLKDAPVTAVANALQGKAPGVQVISNSGAPGGGASVRVRGTNSISANSEPLYVVDGIPFGQGSTAEGTINPLASIDPNNIESMEILKDASATAIYGARGANGVVLITTRRGSRGGRQIQLESSYGQQQTANKVDVLNSQEFMTLANEANTNAGIAPRYTPAQIDTATTFDYLDMILRTAPQQSHALTISGGDERTRFLLSGNYLGQEGVLVNTDFTRVGARLNLDQAISSRFRIGTSLSGTRTVQNVGSAEDQGLNGGVYAALNFAPNVAPRDAQGNWTKLAVTSDQVQNPLANLIDINNPRRTTRIIANVFGEYQLAERLRLRSNVGTNLGFQNDAYYAASTVFQGGAGGVARRYSGDGRELINENTLSYNRQLGPGTIDALVGASVQTSHFEETQAESQLLPSDALGYNNLGAGGLVIAPTSNVIDWTLLSYLGRVNYNLFDRYLFTVTARRDGSSRFGANNKWALFPSASFAWRAINEDFLKNQRVLSDLKLRLSYGRTGNQAIAEYGSLARLGNNFVGLGASPTAVVSLAASTAASNPNLKWETQDQVNAGLDLGFLSNRIAVTVDAYRTKTSDLLLNVDLPGVTGYATQLQNVGSVENRGVELGITTLNVTQEHLTWRTGLNLATNRNEVTSIGRAGRLLVSAGAGSGGSFIITPGEALSSMYGFKVLGLWQQGDTCNLTSTTQCTPGEYKLQDTDGNGAITDNDRVIVGHADPRFYGGFTNNLTFGRFTLDAFLNFTVGNDILNLTKQRNSLVRGVYNERRAVLDRWTPTTTDTDIPRANAARLGARLYSTLVEDGTFARLQTLTLGYQLPATLIRGTQAARVYVTGQNLFTATSYSGFDPEINRWGGNAQLRGVDQSGFPRARVWNVGASLTF